MPLQSRQNSARRVTEDLAGPGSTEGAAGKGFGTGLAGSQDRRAERGQRFSSAAMASQTWLAFWRSLAMPLCGLRLWRVRRVMPTMALSHDSTLHPLQPSPPTRNSTSFDKRNQRVPTLLKHLLSPPCSGAHFLVSPSVTTGLHPSHSDVCFKPTSPARQQIASHRSRGLDSEDPGHVGRHHPLTISHRPPTASPATPRYHIRLGHSLLTAYRSPLPTLSTQNGFPPPW